jgi:hypothetical protein
MDADFLLDVEITEICVQDKASRAEQSRAEQSRAEHTTDNDNCPSKIQTMGARFGCDFEGKMFRLL